MTGCRRGLPPPKKSAKTPPGAGPGGNWLAPAGRRRFMARMQLADARVLVAQALARMAAAYGEPVFTEWVLVSLRPSGGAIMAYDGPRPEKYKQHFQRDLQSMVAELAGHKLGVGDFLFASDAAGSHYDGCLRLGEGSYLFCNHLTRTMTEIRANPAWLAAQRPWAELAARFAADPLV